METAAQLPGGGKGLSKAIANLPKFDSIDEKDLGAGQQFEVSGHRPLQQGRLPEHEFVRAKGHYMHERARRYKIDGLID